MINIDEIKEDWIFKEEDYKDLNIYTDVEDSDQATQDKKLLVYLIGQGHKYTNQQLCFNIVQSVITHIENPSFTINLINQT